MPSVIIGITGSFGAGKGVVVDYLVKNKGYKHFSVRSFITEEVTKRGMPINRDSMIIVGNDMRAKNGPAYIVEALYTKAQAQNINVVIESLRAVAEVRKMRELGGLVIGVDADPHIRFERITKRGSETDTVSYEQWIDQEQRESNPNDPTKQDIFGALKESNIILTNNGTQEELFAQVEKFITEQTFK